MAKVKVKFGDFKNLKKFVRNAAKKDMPNKIEDIILERIAKGISPVANQGRFKGYSQSYKDQINNKAAYRIVNGRPIRFDASAPWGITDSEFNSMRPSSSARRARRQAKNNLKQKITDMNSEITKHGKRVRPVNMKLSGEMLKSFFVKPIDNGFRIGFTSDLADVHNRLGPRGKREFIRRLLPTIPGEQFTKSIIKDIINELKGILRKTKKRAKA